MTSLVGPYPLDGITMPTWLLRFDKHGACTSPTTRQQLLETLHNEPITDVIVFSHGWNNNFSSATDLYTRFLEALEALTDAHPFARDDRPYRPLFIGVVWPSIWLSFDEGPQILLMPQQPHEVRADSAVAHALADELVAHSETADLDRLYGLLGQSVLTASEAEELAALVTPLFSYEDDETGISRDASAADVLDMMQAMQAAQISSTEIHQLRPAGLLKRIDPRSVLRLFSVYQMKDRAGLVGARGVAKLLQDLLAEGIAARVHAVGHSYGAKVMLSALCTPATLVRPLDSLLLLQPAVSHLCFADRIPENNKSGGYRSAVERVTAPILCTYSRHDSALHRTFHLALRRQRDLGEQDLRAVEFVVDPSTTAGKPPSPFAALGGYGPRLASQHLVDPMPAASEPYHHFLDKKAPIIGLDGSEERRIRSHGDVTTPVTAWALHQLMAYHG